VGREDRGDRVLRTADDEDAICGCGDAAFSAPRPAGLTVLGRAA
jgi:hypothetical protein